MKIWGQKFRGQNVDFFLEIMVWWYHGGTMVPTPYLPPAYPLPMGRRDRRFSLGFFQILGPDFLYMQKVVFRVNPLFPPLEVGRHLKNKASRLVQKMTKLRTKSSGARMFTFSGPPHPPPQIPAIWGPIFRPNVPKVL